MEQIWKVAALCLIGAILAALLKKTGPELAILLSLAVVAVVSAMLLQVLNEVFAFARQLMELGGVLPEMFRPLIKTVAIALVSRLGSELCRDAGEGALASVVDMFGAFGAVLVALPLFEAVWDMLRAML